MTMKYYVIRTRFRVDIFKVFLVVLRIEKSYLIVLNLNLLIVSARPSSRSLWTFRLRNYDFYIFLSTRNVTFSLTCVWACLWWLFWCKWNWLWICKIEQKYCHLITWLLWAEMMMMMMMSGVRRVMLCDARRSRERQYSTRWGPHWVLNRQGCWCLEQDGYNASIIGIWFGEDGTM